MGWYYENDCTSADELSAKLEREAVRTGAYKVLANVRTRESGYIVRWTVIETTSSDRSRFITCDLMERDRETACWGYKPMDEGMGPMYFSCPLRLIRLADESGPAPSVTAHEWRAKVRAHHGAKAEKKQADASWFKVGGTAYIVNSGPNWNGTPCTINSVRPLRVSVNYLDVRITRKQLVGTAPGK